MLVEEYLAECNKELKSLAFNVVTSKDTVSFSRYIRQVALQRLYIDSIGSFIEASKIDPSTSYISNIGAALYKHLLATSIYTIKNYLGKKEEDNIDFLFFVNKKMSSFCNNEQLQDILISDKGMIDGRRIYK